MTRPLISTLRSLLLGKCHPADGWIGILNGFDLIRSFVLASLILGGLHAGCSASVFSANYTTGNLEIIRPHGYQEYIRLEIKIKIKL